MTDIQRPAPVAPISWVSSNAPQNDDQASAPTFYDELAQGPVAQQVIAVEAGMDEIVELVDEHSFTQGAERKGAGRKGLARTLLSSGSLSEEEAELVEALASASTAAAATEIVQHAALGVGIKALCAVLERPGLTHERQTQLEQALDGCLQREDWALNVFGVLEFGAQAPREMKQLRELYGYASQGATSLVSWFQRLKAMEDRRRKLKVLAHTFGAELTDDLRENEHERLASIIRDLKKIILFLGFEEFCERAARRLNIEELDSDALMAIGLEMLDEDWLYPDVISDRYDTFCMSLPVKIAYVRTLRNLFGLLSDACFREATQRSQIRETIDTCEYSLVSQEING